MDVTRDNAWATLTRYTKSESLLRHALAVEASTRWYARHFGEDEELWGCTALLHDFDYEIHPTLDKHPQDGAPILRDEGYPEVVIQSVLSHAEHLAIPRDTLLMRTLFACDELSGFIHACGLVRPNGLEGLEPKSVRKKLKQPSFAAGVHRDEVYAGAELLGLELDEHIANVVAALRPIARELGLPSPYSLGRGAASPRGSPGLIPSTRQRPPPVDRAGTRAAPVGGRLARSRSPTQIWPTTSRPEASASAETANETVSRSGASQKTVVPQARHLPRLAPSSESAARSQTTADSSTTVRSDRWAADAAHGPPVASRHDSQ